MKLYYNNLKSIFIFAIGPAVALLVVLFFLAGGSSNKLGLGLFGIGGDDIYSSPDYIGFKVPPLEVGKEIIHFPFTDDNKNETLIIKTDKKTYDGLSQSDVYFSVTNTKRQKQDVELQFLFSEQQNGDIKNLQLWDGEKWQPKELIKKGVAQKPSLKKAFRKRKPLPNNIIALASTDFNIGGKKTRFFKAKVTYIHENNY